MIGSLGSFYDGGIMENRVEHLERQVRRLQGFLIAVAAISAAPLVIAATSHQEEMTLKKINIVDSQGRRRVVIGTLTEPRTESLRKLSPEPGNEPIEFPPGVYLLDEHANQRISVSGNGIEN